MERSQSFLPLSFDMMDELKHDLIEAKQMFLLLHHFLPLSSDSALLTASFVSIDHQVHDS